MKLDDLNDDVLLETFSRLEIKELLSSADMNQRFRDLITQHILFPKYKFNRKFVYIYKNNRKRDKIFIKDSNLMIDDEQIALKLLRHFGHLFSRILINQYDTNLQWRQLISSYINKYCNESLEKLELDSFYDDSLLEWKKPFLNVSSVRFYDGIMDCEKNKWNLSKMFPSLRRVDFDRVDSNFDCLNYHFPNLEHIRFPKYDVPPSTEKKVFGNIFSLNPQLRSINIVTVKSFDLFRVASERLSQLESIEILNFEITRNESDIGTIRFKNLKRFDITINEYSDYDSIVIPLKFDQLEEMKIKMPYSFSWKEKWFNFIAQQQKIKFLTIMNNINSQQLTSIRELPQLEVITTFWSMENGIDILTGLMRIKNLQKIDFVALTAREYDFLGGISDSEWEFKGSVSPYTKEVTFSRIRPTSRGRELDR